MKHHISNIESYFEELENYEFSHTMDISVIEWSILGTLELIHLRQFNSYNKPTYITIGKEYECLQEKIDDKTILVACEQVYDRHELYPVSRIDISTSIRAAKTDCKMKIFYNRDSIRFITKFKLSL